jgi:ABC-type sugar transport system substrate-binding protein
VRYLQHGDVEALVSQQPTAIGSAAVAAAIDAGFGRNPASDQQVPYVVIYRTSLPNAATSRALYRS